MLVFTVYFVYDDFNIKIIEIVITHDGEEYKCDGQGDDDESDQNS